MVSLVAGSNDPGTYADINHLDKSYGEAKLLALDSTGYVDMYLYHIIWADLNKGPDKNTDYTAILRFFKDGSIKLNTKKNKPKPMP